MSSSRCLRSIPYTAYDSTRCAAPWRPLPLSSRTAAFSTTSPLSYPRPPAKQKTRTGGMAKKGDRAFTLKKKVVNRDTGRRPAPGERKALRKRIVLSNTNALEVPGLIELSAENFADAEVQGQVVALPGPVVDSLRAVEAFKTTQGWSLFRRPAALMRKESIEMGKLLNEIGASDESRTVRQVIVGERGCGKSILLLQAMAMAFLKGWIVVHFPEAQDLTIAHTEYAPLPNTNPIQYVQKTYTAQLLSQISKANKSVLSTLQLSSKPSNLPIPIQDNMSLDRLADLGARDPDIAWPIFQALWAELTAPSNPDKPELARPPLLLALDSLGHVMGPSAYLNPAVKPIHAHDLALVSHFVQHLGGAAAATLPNGGLVVGAHSASNKPSCATLDFAVERNEALARGLEAPRWDAYRPIDERVLQAMEGVEVVRLLGLSREEARSIMEYYAASGMLRGTVNEALVSEKWTLAGGGVVGELERNAVRLRI